MKQIGQSKSNPNNPSARSASTDDHWRFVARTEREEKERRALSPITVRMDPGSTRYLLSTSAENTKESFESRFPTLNFERQFALHSPVAGTTLEIILTGVSLGAGVVATEFLKELGKKLWRSVEELLPAKSEQLPETSEQLYGDRVKIILTIGDSSIETEIEGLRSNSTARLETFLNETPVKLYVSASEVLGTREHCPMCLNESLSVAEIPCRYCEHNGDKLLILKNALCTLDRSPVPTEFNIKQRKGDFFVGRSV